MTQDGNNVVELKPTKEVDNGKIGSVATYSSECCGANLGHVNLIFIAV